MGGAQAKEYGLIDDVLTPKKKYEGADAGASQERAEKSAEPRCFLSTADRFRGGSSRRGAPRHAKGRKLAVEGGGV